jgi:hypothetical protein
MHADAPVAQDELKAAILRHEGDAASAALAAADAPASAGQ